DGLKLLRPRFFLDTLAHGVFLRWPPCKAARWSCTSPAGRMRHFSFPPESGHDQERLQARLISAPVLGVVGVLTDGRKHLLALELCGGESFAAWKGCLDDLVARGLRAPVLAVIDG